jgi:pimeloyl-ACP methyl ester carboxylesterase
MSNREVLVARSTPLCRELRTKSVRSSGATIVSKDGVRNRPNIARPAAGILKTQCVQLKREGLRIRYAELGDPGKPTAILLHGVPENLQAWYAVAPLLARTHHVLALDWPGFGGSDPFASPDDYTSRRFADIVVDFMDSLDIGQASLVATDISLLPSLLVGLEHPSRVSKLAVMDGVPFVRPQHTSWELRSFTRKGSLVANALVRWFPRISTKITHVKGFYRGHAIPTDVRREFNNDGHQKHTQDAFLSYFQNFREGQEYFEPKAGRLETPTLVVWGKHDRFISSKLGHELVETLPNARLEVIDKAGHYVHMDRPEEVARVVAEFLSEDPERTVTGTLGATGSSDPPPSPASPEPKAIPKHKTALLIWMAVFPTVLLLTSLLATLPIELPRVVATFLVTAIAIPLVV